jgi:hypothetical protein
MNIVITILLVIAAIIALIFLVALFIKKEYRIEKEIIINKPKSEVFDYVKLQKNQDQYNKWWSADPDAKKDFKGVDGTIGFIAAWDSMKKEMGKGEQEIKRIKEGEQIDCEIRFERPFEGVSQTEMLTSAIGDNQTRVKWIFNGSNKYPMNAVFFFLSLDKMLGKDLMLSLEKLKTNLEK